MIDLLNVLPQCFDQEYPFFDELPKRQTKFPTFAENNKESNKRH